MRYSTVLERSSSAADRGDLMEASKLLSAFLGKKSHRQRLVDYAKASLYLGYIHHLQGNFAEALPILDALSKSEATDMAVRVQALGSK